jgi:sporulation protein YlmC with PRC-barrel domain
MMYRIKQFYGDHLRALDGEEVGHFADCYIDEQKWAVRYFAVNTDWWSPPRRVLLSPHAFGAFPKHGRILPVNLTRRQIENGPSLDLNEPLTKKHEEDYFYYYNWPFYWMGGLLWGPSDFPTGGAAPQRQPGKPAGKTIKADSHLRSARELFGLQVCHGSEVIGAVTDFVIDGSNWHIPHLVIAVGHHWPVPNTILLSTRKVSSIDWNAQRVNVTASSEEIKRALLQRELVLA